MKKNIKRSLAVLLSALLLAGCCVPALATVRTVTEEEKPDMIRFFTRSVNSIKADLPGATVVYNNYVPENGITTGQAEGMEELDAVAQRYLIPILEGLFNDRSSVMKGFIRAQFGDEGNTVEKLELEPDTLRNKTVPLYNKETVSELTPDDDVSMIADIAAGKTVPDQLAVSFQNTSLAEGKAGPLGKAFSLPSGAFNPMIISGDRTNLTSRLDDAKFQSFDLKNARIITKYTADGTLAYYGSTIDYFFSFSFYDAMNIISAILGYNFYTAVINTVNVILENLGKEGVSAEDVLRSKRLYITYRCMVEIRNLRYSSRLFGDINDDGAVTAEDARDALRSSVGLCDISDPNERIRADIDFDGRITAADARLILRGAVGLDDELRQAPDGKVIRIVDPEADVIPPDDDEPAGNVDEGPLGDLDPTITLADIANAVFSYIEAIKGTEGETQTYIQQFIDSIKNAVQEKKDEEP